MHNRRKILVIAAALAIGIGTCVPVRQQTNERKATCVELTNRYEISAITIPYSGGYELAQSTGRTVQTHCDTYNAVADNNQYDPACNVPLPVILAFGSSAHRITAMIPHKYIREYQEPIWVDRKPPA